MAGGTAARALDELDVFVGEWTMSAAFPSLAADPPRARATFEWLPGNRFLIQRWEVELPEAPDGIAIIGFDGDRQSLVQRYFDSRGVARIYDMTFSDGVWTLERRASAPDFSQRFTGRFGDDGRTIVGDWEISNDGSTWSHDFALTYRRVGS
jgi:hypothetical protein